MIALVTGGNRGIGLEICRVLSEKYGFKVYMGCRNIIKGEEAIKLNELKNVFPFEINVSSEQSISQAAQRFNDKIFLLINNAGAQLDWIPSKSHVKSLDVTEELLTEIYRTNVFASVFMCKYFFPFMEKGGRVVNVSSGSGEFWDVNSNKDFQIGYAPSKSALLMTTKKLAAAALQYGIAVNACCPGWCKTAMGGEPAPSTAKDGAFSVIAAAFLDMQHPPSGGYFRNGRRIPIDLTPKEIGYANVLSIKTQVAKSQVESYKRYIENNRWQNIVDRLYEILFRNEFEKYYIKKSCLFDEDYYKQQMPAADRMASHDSIAHYCLEGWKAGLNPTVWFNSQKYLAVNKDVKENPFYHYLRYGIFENRLLE